MSTITYIDGSSRRLATAAAIVIAAIVGAGFSTTTAVVSDETGDRLVIAALEDRRALGFVGNVAGTTTTIIEREMAWQQTVTVSDGEDHLGRQVMRYRLIAVRLQADGAGLHVGSTRLYR